MPLPASSDASVADVRATLQTFQDGYSRRDLSTLDIYMDLFAPDTTLEVLGTSASARTEDEWCTGIAAVRQLIAADWQFWGDLLLDVAGAHIHRIGSVAWLATTGTITQIIPLEQRYTNITNYLQRVMNRQTELDVERELLLVILGSASALANARDGERYIWPLRFTAVLIEQRARWQFHQIHFSYPTIHDPDVRLV
jgi:hypothetical protein